MASEVVGALFLVAAPVLPVVRHAHEKVPDNVGVAISVYCMLSTCAAHTLKAR